LRENNTRYTTVLSHLHSILEILFTLFRLATGWTTEGSEFGSRKGQEFSLLQVAQTGSGVHPTSYPMGTGGKAAGAWSWPLTSN
jgi:hypothetical protein